MMPKGKNCTGAELAVAVKKAALTSEDAKAWSKDLKKARKALKPTASKWH